MSGNQKPAYLAVPSFDGPSDTRSQHGGSQHSGSSHSRHPSQVSGMHVGGSQAGGSSRPPSNAGAASGPTGYPQPLGYDPGRDNKPEEKHFNSRLDLPPEAYVQTSVGRLTTPFSRRPTTGKEGKKVPIRVNQFRILSVPNCDVSQYDVSLSPDLGKPAFTKKVWNTHLVQRRLKQDDKYGKLPFMWIFDGRKIVWSRNKVPELRIMVDMDVEQGRAPNLDRPNKFLLIIKHTTTVRLECLRAYLEGKMGWDEPVLECINFFDHVIRQWPTENMIAIKRNFYNKTIPTSGHHALDHQRTIEAVKGIYAAIRLNSSMRSAVPGGIGLGVNIDVTNTAFWRGGQPLSDFCLNYLRSCKKEWDNKRWPEVYDGMRPDEYTDSNRPGVPRWGMSDMFKALRRLHKLKFTVRHRGKANDEKVYTIQSFIFDEKYGKEGAHAKNVTFKWQNRDISVNDYFLEKYNIRLHHWRLPLIQTTRAGTFPMECVIMHNWQKYNFKLSGDQTASMIKFAVTKPPQRGGAIMENVRALRWQEDPYLREFGIRIDQNMTTVPARILNNPVIQFGKGGTKNPGNKGRWDLMGQTFSVPNPRPLNAWGFIVINSCVDRGTVARFANTFMTTYKGHGGRVVMKENRDPQIFNLNLTRSAQPAEDLENLYRTIGNKANAAPDLIFFVLPDKNMHTYERLKRNMDIRLATLSQMLQSGHVAKANAQYCSNVAMKVNAKLGGSTSSLAGKRFFKKPTMMIGVDVSHASPGTESASMAAMTMSMDENAIRYAAACETNGSRVEVLARQRIRQIFPPMVARWCQKNGKLLPQHVFYFRDGVDEGQFAKVMEEEVAEVRLIFQEVFKCNPQITVIVATKRHHIRFFPPSNNKDAGDQNGNAYPGTVIEQEVTHPWHYDFYLCSHKAIQGTARPVHYHVIHDEVCLPVDELQQIIYQQCYQYVRSTTPVSIHPSIYYAHLAAARARAHEDIEFSERDPANRRNRQQQPLAKHNDSDRQSSSRLRAQEMGMIPLQPIGGKEGKAAQVNIDFFKETMWYI